MAILNDENENLDELFKQYAKHLVKYRELPECNNDEVCGYCRYHRCKLTVGHLKKKGCLHKENTSTNCRHLEKHQSKYWDLKKLKKVLKEQRRRSLNI